MSTIYYAVFDTNVIVSALMSKRKSSPTVKLLDFVLSGTIILLYNEAIIAEYTDVLHRSKFHFDTEQINSVMNLVRLGLNSERIKSEEKFPDSDDRVFYEVSLSKDDAYMVTGNQRHFPKVPKVVSPAEMLAIINASY